MHRCLLTVSALGVTLLGAPAWGLTNFESGTTEGWTAGYSLTVEAGGPAGSAYDLRCSGASGSWDQSLNLDLLAAGLWGEVAGGTTLSIDLMAQGGSDVPGWWLQMFPVINSQNGGWNQGYFGVNLDGQWATYTYTYPAQPADPGAYAQLILVNQGGGPLTFRIDNVVIPEPATLGAMGALALLAVRRRTR